MSCIATALHPVVAQAVAFTAAHRQHADAHPAVREAACLRTQFPALMGAIRPGDAFAGGQAEGRICYLGSIWWAMLPDRAGPGKQGGYCFDFAAQAKWGTTEADRAAIAELETYWQERVTVSRFLAEIDPTMLPYMRTDAQVSAPGSNGFCVALDMDRLLRLGLPGLEAQIDAARGTGDQAFLDGLREAIAIVRDVCLHYAAQARALAAAADAAERPRLERIAASCAAIAVRAPADLHEAMQLLWLYSLVAGGRHIECFRIDDALGGFLQADLAAGRLDEAAAEDMVLGLWRMWAQHGDPAVCRVVIGGLGRRDPPAADAFARLALRATRRHRGLIPQLTLRFHAGQDRELTRLAFDALGDGCVFPMFYNDDAIVPGVARALCVDEAEAARYHPLGCGEYMLAGANPSLLNYGWSVPKTLEAALHGGRAADGRPLGPTCKALPELASYDELIANMRTQADFAASLTARGHAISNRVLGRECSFLLASLLSDDCIARGRALMDGGVRHDGACIMGHGFTNTADALNAIRRTVFAERTVGAAELLTALAADFAGHEAVRRRLLAVPKFGNDDPAADRTLAEVWRLLSGAAAAAGRRAGISYYTVSSVNPGGYYMGALCGATADGRRAGAPFAIGHAPTAGNDRGGLTALMTSLSAADAANGGVASNIKLAKAMFHRQRPQLEALFDAFWKQGGQQASVTVVDQADLVDALAHPERHPNLLVRLGGWTARFVALERQQQEDIIRRSIY